MLFDIERTEELCPICKAKLEMHTTSGPIGKLRMRLWCPNRDYVGPWEVRKGEYVPGKVF